MDLRLSMREVADGVVDARRPSRLTWHRDRRPLQVTIRRLGRRSARVGYALRIRPASGATVVQRARVPVRRVRSPPAHEHGDRTRRRNDDPHHTSPARARRASARRRLWRWRLWHTDDEGDDDRRGGGRRAACDKKLAFFGPLTGAAAGLGQHIVNGVQLALDEYNDENADCKVELEEVRLAGQPGRRRPSWRPRSSATTPSSASSARRSPVSRAAAGPTFAEAGLPTDHAVGHQPDPRRERLGHVPPRPRQRRHPGPGRREVHHRDRRRQEGLRRSTTPRSTARASPTSSRTTLGDAGRRHRHRPAEADRLLGDRDQGQGLRRRRASSTAATTPRPACWSSSCATAAANGTFVVG